MRNVRESGQKQITLCVSRASRVILRIVLLILCGSNAVHLCLHFGLGRKEGQFIHMTTKAIPNTSSAIIQETKKLHQEN